jgi:hypothetical protein
MEPVFSTADALPLHHPSPIRTRLSCRFNFHQGAKTRTRSELRQNAFEQLCRADDRNYQAYDGSDRLVRNMSNIFDQDLECVLILKYAGMIRISILNARSDPTRFEARHV